MAEFEDTPGVWKTLFANGRLSSDERNCGLLTSTSGEDSRTTWNAGYGDRARVVPGAVARNGPQTPL